MQKGKRKATKSPAELNDDEKPFEPFEENDKLLVKETESIQLTEENSDKEENNESEVESDTDSEGIPSDSESELEFEDDDGQPIVGVPKFASEKQNVNYAEENDSEDEEDLKNTVGNIPIEWYNEFSHIGYGLDGDKLLKPNSNNKDEIDKFLEKMDDPNFKRTIIDKMTNAKHVLSDEELEMISRLQMGNAYSSSVDMYAPMPDMYSHEKCIHPLTNAPAHKRSFVPSKDEARKVGKLVHAIKMGWLKLKKPAKVEESQRSFYNLWDTAAKNASKSDNARIKMHIKAPKEQLPGHELSYNPPPEYLPTKEEREAMENPADSDEERDMKMKHIPTAYGALRKVPQNPIFIQEIQNRCLDKLLCPRQRKMKVKVNPEDLIPDVPKRSELKPFPEFQNTLFEGHTGMVRSISVNPDGCWLASGSDDCTVKIWEQREGGRCAKTYKFDDKVKMVSWCPSQRLMLLAVVVGSNLYLMNPGVGGDKVKSQTDKYIKSFEREEDDNDEKVNQMLVEDWKVFRSEQCKYHWIQIKHARPVAKIVWQSLGDYFATVMTKIAGMATNQILIHKLSTRITMAPFTRMKGTVQMVQFHPKSNCARFFVATQLHVYIYDLQKQKKLKKLMCNTKYISDISIHPEGDNMLVGTYDRRLAYFDLQYSTKPYKQFRYHEKAVRSVHFHNKYPLFASAGDDCNVLVFHNRVYDDLDKSASISLVKMLKGMKISEQGERSKAGVTCVYWHPSQPWIYTAGSDCNIRMFT